MMKKITEHLRVTKSSLKKMIGVASISALLFIGIPLVSKIISDSKEYYVVTINNEEIGAVSNEQDAYKAYLNARCTINKEAQYPIYMDEELLVTKKNKLFGKKLDIKELETIIYEKIKDDGININEKAYTVIVNNNKLTLRTQDEVMELLDRIKNQYDTSGKFHIELEKTVTYDDKTQYDTNIVSSDIAVMDAARVLATIDEDGEVVTQVDNPYYQDGVLSVEFVENVKVKEILAPDEKVTTVDKAYECLTKQDDEKQIYEVKQGDCLTFIAENHGLYMAELLALNPTLTWDSMLSLGQEIVVSVPKPELSVIVKEEITTTEEFYGDTIYVENPNVYSGTNTVIREAEAGVREAVVLVEYTNGNESKRTILKESITKEAVPMIVEKGTKEMPTYIKPISGGTLTSKFGKRWGTIHYGVDWGCPLGTYVKASCDGKVITAGWQNGYGYTVVLSHSDGSTTRYAHLSKIAVSIGDKVKQGELIAYSGNTGNSTGPHLHFEIMINGTKVDPLEYLE